MLFCQSKNPALKAGMNAIPKKDRNRLPFVPQGVTVEQCDATEA